MNKQELMFRVHRQLCRDWQIYGAAACIRPAYHQQSEIMVSALVYLGDHPKEYTAIIDAARAGEMAAMNWYV